MNAGTAVEECIGNTLHDQDGTKIGEVEDVYLDDATNEPEWFAVKTGFFGAKVGFVPVRGSFWNGDQLSVNYSKELVKTAPHAEADGQLSETEESQLYAHYDMRDTEVETTERQSGDGNGRDNGRTDTAMTRSEEELAVGTQRRAAGKARLRKVVETEHKTVTVPVQRERVEVVTEPITDANRDKAMDGPEITESVHEETLYEEVPVVEKKVVAKERVRLEKETTTDQQQIDADLRKERIQVDGDDARTEGSR